jgi:hypothetical protein
MYACGQPVERFDDGWHMLAARGLAIGIALEDVATPGSSVHLADTPGAPAIAEAGEAFDADAQLISDSEGRVVVARLGVRLSEPILAIAVESATEKGQLVAVKIAPANLRT